MFNVIRYFQAIPPGMEFSHIVPHDVDLDGDEANEVGSGSPDPPIWADVCSFPIYPSYMNNCWCATEITCYILPYCSV
jgi:hypothetical protein